MPSLQAVGSDEDHCEQTGALVWSAIGVHRSGITAFTPAQTNRTKGRKTNSSAIQTEPEAADVKPP